MANPSYGRCYPFGAPAAGEDDQRAQAGEWRHLAGAWGDGIVNAYGSAGASSFALTRSTSDRTVTLHLDEMRIKGCHFEPTQDTLALTIPAVAAGWQRADRVVATFSPTAKNITFSVKTGTAVQSGTLPLPGLTRVTGGVWEVSLYILSGGNVAASALDVTDQRLFIGEHLHGLSDPGPNTELNLGRSDGSAFYNVVTGHTWKQTYPGGVSTWTDIDNPPWTDLNIGGGIVAGQSTPQYRVRRGQVELRGHGVRASNAVWGSTNASTLQEITVGTLPASLAPAVTHEWVARATGGGGSAYQGMVPIYVTTAGEINITVYAGLTIGGVFYDPIRYTAGA